MMRVDPQTYVKELSQDRARINRLRQDILHDKTLELVASKGKEKVDDSARAMLRTDFTTYTKNLIQNMGAYLPLPYVYEREGRQERAWDIYSRLLRDRIVFIGTPRSTITWQIPS